MSRAKSKKRPKPRRKRRSLTAVERVMAWRKAHPKKYRDYMRQYMRWYRSGKVGPRPRPEVGRK